MHSLLPCETGIFIPNDQYYIQNWIIHIILDDLFATNIVQQLNHLNNYQCIENGKDTGINVRRKLKTMTEMINNRNMLLSEREKAAVQANKFHGGSTRGFNAKGGLSSEDYTTRQVNKGIRTTLFRTKYCLRHRSILTSYRFSHQKPIHLSKPKKMTNLVIYWAPCQSNSTKSIAICVYLDLW